MTLVQGLRVVGGQYAKPNIYENAADRINALENLCVDFARAIGEALLERSTIAVDLQSETEGDAK